MGKTENNNRIIKEQSTVFKKPNHPEINTRKYEKIEPQALREEESPEKEMTSLAISRVPSADKMRPSSRKMSKVDLRVSKSTYRILPSSTVQNFFKDPNAQSVTQFKPIERVQTAKSNTNEGEMRRTRVLMDKISGRQGTEAGRPKIETTVE